jgi:hypothetical protein
MFWGPRLAGQAACSSRGFCRASHWAMHTDHDNAYEQTASRVHVPLITSPETIRLGQERRTEARGMDADDAP